MSAFAFYAIYWYCSLNSISPPLLATLWNNLSYLFMYCGTLSKSPFTRLECYIQDDHSELQLLF